ncbi:hypothetical protein EJ05DRAFT_515288 [Pseudovirgaria hyperparasitica]|uniref:C2H2-type domain-containing protein n=1 Tax=Pseudovirgaria hyperparasitica TaxID=470096 RepID=A0A6A6VUJ6_9PEZI|nr:uncharacterized protein EJ05DRAFT_515288 [Pseudovirgaria hyperparasitica]KAF2752921.1 hypothetical protein EJ05DRAFT_515288 [Pseudovirgaria hyperparasitica]
MSNIYPPVPHGGVQHHKRPRRRYDEIERIYNCSWNGCEKAYGTLSHLNVHVTTHSHGMKRTAEEFKEIREEGKAKNKKKEERLRVEDGRTGAEGRQTNCPQVYSTLQSHISTPGGVVGSGPQLLINSFVPTRGEQSRPHRAQSPAILY